MEDIAANHSARKEAKVDYPWTSILIVLNTITVCNRAHGLPRPDIPKYHTARKRWRIILTALEKEP